MNVTKSSKKVEEFRLSPFQSKRAKRSSQGIVHASPETLFPLLCSTREADWLPNSNHRLVYSLSGYAEDAYIFESDFFGVGKEIWYRYEHKTNQSLAYVRNSENLVIVFRIDLTKSGDSETRVEITQTFTSLSEEGNRYIESLPEDVSITPIISALNHYVETGEQIAIGEAS